MGGGARESVAAGCGLLLACVRGLRRRFVGLYWPSWDCVAVVAMLAYVGCRGPTLAGVGCRGPTIAGVGCCGPALAVVSLRGLSWAYAGLRWPSDSGLVVVGSGSGKKSLA